MKRLFQLAMAIVSMVFLGSVLTSGNASAQVSKELVGTWTFVSAVDIQKDGTKMDRWGPNPKGMLVFDATGHYVLVITRASLPKITANRVDQGTAEENKAIMQGLIVTFGTYSVNEADKTVTTKIEGGSFPNLNGMSQKRIIKSLTADELRYTNPASTIGTTAEAVWKRAK